MTPSTAMNRAVGPVRFSCWISVSSPAMNMSMSTPISAVCMMNSVDSITLKQLGPSMMPASNAPTTWGWWAFSVTRPRALVDSRITASHKI